MSEGTVQEKLSRFLFSYRITPQTTTGMSPAELLMGRTLRSRLHLLKPNLSRTVENKQEQQKLNHDKRAIHRTFQKGEKVFARNYASIGKKWLYGVVISVTQRSLTSGLVIHHHFDQIRKRSVEEIPKDTELVTDSDAYTYLPVSNDEPETSSSQLGSPDVPATGQLPQNRRYPLRTRKAPDRRNL